MENQLQTQHLMVEPPRGMYPSRLDDKGRLKLPTTFQQFFAALREKKLYATSLDRRTAQVYPMEVWRANESFFQGYKGADIRLARIASFNAADLGSETEMDGQGRILFSPELRRALEMENQPVRVLAHPNGRLEVLTEAAYEERKREAMQITPDDVSKLEAEGLN